MSKYEDKDICSRCGGFCCKKSGCDYSTDNFTDLSINALQEKLAEGNMSIVAMLNFHELSNGKLTVSPFLYLRARNKDRDVVDLLSLKKTCSMLTDTGCSYSLEDRPKGGVNLLPRDPKPCVPDVDPYEIVKGWERYQKVLQRLVKRITGMSVDAKLREDVINLYVDILEENFDGVSPIEIEDIRGMIFSLIKVYPEELRIAQKRVNGRKKVYVNK